MTAGEIVARLYWSKNTSDEKGQDDVFLMLWSWGIGEPFDNYVNLMNFYEQLMMIMAFIGARHITVSTCGFMPAKIKEFAK